MGLPVPFLKERAVAGLMAFALERGREDKRMTKNCQVEFQEHATASGLLIGHATLTAPASLNALTLDMIDALDQRLRGWQQDDRVVAVILDGAGGKAFCAGGDIRQLHTSVLESDHGPNPYGESFFAREYRLDYLIHSYTKPILCWGAGIVMGGGIGLMAGASHRIVTPSSKLAMPEVSIGLFPDVGGSWILGRMPGRVGLFLGLTGARLNASDALFCGMADRLLEDGSLLTVIEHMQALDWQNDSATGHQLLTGLLRALEQEQAVAVPPSPVRDNFDRIQQVTDADTPKDMLEQMQSLGDKWWQRAAATLAQGCPVTACLVVEQLRRARHLSLADVFRMELNMAVMCLRNPNFSEGVRALLLERDSTPQWQPAELGLVTPELLATFFKPLWSAKEHPLADI